VLRRLTLVVVTAGCAARGPGGAAPSAVGPSLRPSPRPAVVAPAAPVVVDVGELELSLRGKPAGREAFTIARTADGFRIDSEVRLEQRGTLRLIVSELETDAAWRPRAATVRDVIDGGTTTTLGGAPLTLRATARLGASAVRTASRPIDLYLADNTLAHFAPICALPAPAVRTGFPGMEVRVGDARPAPPFVQRTVDLGATVRALITCEATRLVAVELPALALVAVRSDRAPALRELVGVPATKAPLAAGLIEEPRTIRVAAARGREAAELACSLVRPAAAAGPLPVALLLTGSGAQDRDEDAVGAGGIKLGLLRAIASALGTAGVASLRCDDRGIGASTGEFGAATLPTFIADAQAAVGSLRRERGLDPRRVILVGHSEGGVVAAAVAAADPRVAGVALLAAPGRPVDEVLLAQVAHTLAKGGLTDAEAAAALARHQAAFAAIRAGQPLPDTAEADEWAGGEAWLRSHMRHDGLAAVRALACPLWIAQGAIDQQVTPVDAAALAAAARAGGAPVVERSFPSLDHAFVVSATGDVAEYATPGRQVDPTFLAELAAFVAAVPARPDR
jgi:pimeloyl-ACP methyl ester carboxylesterase